MTVMHRRNFLAATGTAMAALAAGGCATSGFGARNGRIGFGPLAPDVAGLLDLPKGFTYRIVSQLGDAMSDGFTVPDAADGMGCFHLGDGKLALVRNHELVPGRHDGGGVTGNAFDYVGRSLVPLPGGTTTIVLDARSLEIERQYRSLAGTIRNCAGGTTPWGSWLTCEEAPIRAGGQIGQDHGWTFEVPADAPGLVDPVPLKAMGRFNHEAACVDPRTGYVYQTEDRDDGLLYRFVPEVPGRLAKGGKLQALSLASRVADTRNWTGVAFAPESWAGARWVDLTEVESPNDDLRTRGAAAGAAVFARGEGIWMGDGELYFTATSGGTAKLGQIFRLDVTGTDRLQLFLESNDINQLNFGDNLTVSPFGDLFVCEDQYTDPPANFLRGVTTGGMSYPFARLHANTELAGVCFSPVGMTMFLNIYSPAKTLAISGPWI